MLGRPPTSPVVIRRRRSPRCDPSARVPRHPRARWWRRARLAAGLRSTARTRRRRQGERRRPARTPGLDVGAGIEKSIEYVDVVTAGRPVQRRLGVRAREPRVDVGTRLDQRHHVCAPLGKCPGQSVATLSKDRVIPPGSSSPSRAVARSGLSASSRRTAATSPAWIASTTATATGSSVLMVTMPRILPPTRRGVACWLVLGDPAARRLGESDRPLARHVLSFDGHSHRWPSFASSPASRAKPTSSAAAIPWS